MARILAFLVAASTVLVPPASAAADRLACSGSSGPSKVTRPPAYEFGDEEVVHLRSEHDGAQIELGVVRPRTDDPVPVIVRASPYFFDGLAEGRIADCDPRLADTFVPQGYAVVLVPVRGTANAGGCSDLMGPAERADLDQAVRWLGEQPWSNGSVAMIGVSYDGSTPWEVASMGNPYLKTIVPISGVNDPYDLMYGDGVVETRGPALLNAAYYQYGFVGYNPTTGRSVEHSLQGAICPEAWAGLAASLYSSATGQRDPLGFWAERNLRPGVEENYRGSVLLVQGLQDHNVDTGHQYPWVHELERRGIYVKHLLGQWGHAWPDQWPADYRAERGDWADLLLAWFDRWLKGDATVDVGARVEVQDSKMRWRRADRWPPVETTAFELAPDGRASEQLDMTPALSAASGAQPLCPASCSSFRTATLDEELLFAGRPQLRLRVVPTGPGGHLSASIFTSSGQLLGGGQIDLRFANGGDGSPLVPGRAIDVMFDLEPLDAAVSAGDEIVVTLAQGWYGDHLPSAVSAPVLIEGAPALVLNTYTTEASAYFVPPTVPS